MAFAVMGFSSNNNDEWLRSLPEPWLLSNDEISEILPEFQKRYPAFDERFIALSKWRIGTPYEIFKLGEETEPDTDPLIRIDLSDCTSHILCNLALTQSSSWAESREKMTTIHYKQKDGSLPVPSYETRWHYTLDRITNNPYTVNITETAISSDKLIKTTIILNKKEDGSNFLPIPWEKETILNYIPPQNVTQELLDSLPDLCGIAFVRKSYFKMGIAIAHEGTLIKRKNLIHASSDAGKTSSIDFLKYFHRDDGPLFDGIMIYKFVPIQN